MAFTIEETQILNQLIQQANPASRTKPVFVDNLHTLYTELEEEYILPSSSVFHVDFDAAFKFLESMVKYLPEAISGCTVLPDHRPKRETGSITLFREFDLEESKFLYLISFRVSYLGGAKADKILFTPPQEKTASVVTNRVYFSTKIVPLDSLVLDGGIPVNFKTRQYNDSLTRVATSMKNPLKESISELFDEVDYSDIINFLKTEWQINAEFWKPGRIFSPLAVEYYTVSFRFIDLNQSNMIQEFGSFYKLADSLFSDTITGLDTAMISYHNWLKSHKPERIQSPSGNMSWQIHRISQESL